MTQYYPTTNAAAAVWGGASGSSFPVFAMLINYTCFSLLAMCTIVSFFMFLDVHLSYLNYDYLLTYLLPTKALSKTLLFVVCLLQTQEKERCESSRWLSNLQPCYDKVRVNVDLYSAFREHTSKAVRYGTRSQGISTVLPVAHVQIDTVMMCFCTAGSLQLVV